MTADVDQAVEQLDQHAAGARETWDMWRTADRWWVVTLRQGSNDPCARTVTAYSLAEALRLAALSVRLPMVPTRRTRINARDFTPEKQGRKWVARHPTVGYIGPLDTRRECVEAADRISARCCEAADRWDREWAGLVDAGVVDVDYRWAW